MTEIPTKDRIMALLSPPSLDVWLIQKDARWILAHIKELDAKLEVAEKEVGEWKDFVRDIADRLVKFQLVKKTTGEVL